MIADAVAGIVKGVTGIFTAKTRRKQAQEEGLNRIQQAKVDGKNDLDLTDAEWEAVSAKSGDGSWKDEYAVVTMTAWVWVGLVGAIMTAYGKPEVLEGVSIFIRLCTDNAIDIGMLTTTVIYAAVGLKLWRSR